MSIIYILISIITIVTFILLKKNNKKENLLLWVGISIILLMCFNIFITFLFNTIKIKSTLTNLSLSLITITILMILKIYKKREIQKYYIKKQDIIFELLLLIAVIIVAVLQYGNPFNIKYAVTDGSVHYLATIEFYKSSDLLSNLNETRIQEFNVFMTGAYVNCGILLKSLSNFLSVNDYYTVFVIFDLIIFFLSGKLFYTLISEKLKKKTEYILAYIVTIIYLFAYPLNSLLSGFCYLSLGLDIILAIIIILKYLIKEESTIIILTMSLLSTGLFFSYYFFIPVMYGAIFVCLILKSVSKKEKIVSEKNIIEFLYIFIIPAMFGMYYMFFKEMFTQNYVLPTKALSIEGYIYTNKITNFIILIPLVCYYIIYNIKNKKKDNLLIILIFELIFIISLAIGNSINWVSDYYFFKAYYLLWILMLLINFKALVTLIRKNELIKLIVYTIIIAYVIVLIIFVGKIDNSIYLYDIYKYNLDNIKKECILENSYLDVVEYYFENLEEYENDIYIIPGSSEGRNGWIYSLYQNIIYTFFDENIEDINDWIYNQKEKYIIYYKGDLDYEPNYEDERYDVIFNNESGAILKRKGE